MVEQRFQGEEVMGEEQFVYLFQIGCDYESAHTTRVFSSLEKATGNIPANFTEDASPIHDHYAFTHSEWLTIDKIKVE